jgi:hypothetical protein
MICFLNEEECLTQSNVIAVSRWVLQHGRINYVFKAFFKSRANIALMEINLPPAITSS